MNSIEFMNYYNEACIAEESFNDFIENVVEFGDRVMDTIEKVIEEIIAKILLFVSKIRGQKIYQGSYHKMSSLIMSFEENILVYYRELHEFYGAVRDVKAGKLSPSAVTDSNADMDELEANATGINNMKVMLQELKADLEQTGSIDPKHRIYNSDTELISNTEALSLQKSMLRMSNDLRRIKKDFKMPTDVAKTVKEFNLEGVANGTLNAIRQMLVESASVFFEACAYVKVKPAKVTSASESVDADADDTIPEFITDMTEGFDALISAIESDINAFMNDLDGIKNGSISPEGYTPVATQYWGDEVHSWHADLKSVYSFMKDAMNAKVLVSSDDPMLANAKKDIASITPKFQKLKKSIPFTSDQKKTIKELKLDGFVKEKLEGGKKEILDAAKMLLEGVAYMKSNMKK